MGALLREDCQSVSRVAKKHQSEEAVRLGTLMDEAGKIRQQLEKREITREEAYRRLDDLRSSGQTSFFRRSIWKGL